MESGPNIRERRPPAQAYPREGGRPKLSFNCGPPRKRLEGGREGANILRNSRRTDGTIQEPERFLHHREGGRKILSESASPPPDSRGLSRATTISARCPRLRSRGRTERELPQELTAGGPEQGARSVVASSPIVRCGSGFRLAPVLASFFFLLL
jgi:hypothetical protein